MRVRSSLAARRGGPTLDVPTDCPGLGQRATDVRRGARRSAPQCRRQAWLQRPVLADISRTELTMRRAARMRGGSSSPCTRPRNRRWHRKRCSISPHCTRSRPRSAGGHRLATSNAQNRRGSLSCGLGRRKPQHPSRTKAIWPVQSAIRRGDRPLTRPNAAVATFSAPSQPCAAVQAHDEVGICRKNHPAAGACRPDATRDRCYV